MSIKVHPREGAECKSKSFLFASSFGCSSKSQVELTLKSLLITHFAILQYIGFRNANSNRKHLVYSAFSQILIILVQTMTAPIFAYKDLEQRLSSTRVSVLQATH